MVFLPEPASVSALMHLVHGPASPPCARQASTGSRGRTHVPCPSGWWISTRVPGLRSQAPVRKDGSGPRPL